MVSKDLREMSSRKEVSDGETVRVVERKEGEGSQWERRMEEVRAQLASRNAEIVTLQ